MKPAAIALLVVAWAGCGSPPSPPESADGGRLGQVQVWRPAAPDGVVFLFSDEAGWGPAWGAAAEAIRADGAAVVGVDLPVYLRALRASADGCHYLISEIEDLSKRLQRELASTEYHSPILAGAGAGGTLAYAALAQAPAATVAGAVAVDPAPVLATRVPLCPGAEAQPAPGGGFRYAPLAPLPGFYRAVPSEGRPPTEELASEVVAVLRTGRSDALAGLPLVALPTGRPGRSMAVIYSGDGGWRDLDKTVGEALARSGVPVVGVDSLRYFWRERTPQQVADDLARIVEHYAAAWGTPEVALIGYSFGAGILPFAYNRLPAITRRRVRQITLLGLEPRAPFHFQVGGWLRQVGLPADPYRNAPLVLPELLRIDPGIVQCVYGEQEADTLCTAPELAGAEILHTSGGHHFDGDYAALARRILAGMERRGAPVPPAPDRHAP